MCVFWREETGFEFFDLVKGIPINKAPGMHAERFLALCRYQ